MVAIFWMLEADNRAKERHYRAWDLINSGGARPAMAGEEPALPFASATSCC